MVKFLVINKRGNTKTINTTASFELSNLYRKCGLKTDKHFEARGSWGWNGKHIVVFAANDGKAGQENKFDLPPPLDTHLFFGGIALVCIDGDEISEDTMSNFTEKNWKQLYEKLLGGFEDLDEDSEFDDEEDEDLDGENYTKEGYSKEDGFVVDSDDEEFADGTGSSSGEEDDDDDEDSDSDYVPPDSDELSEDDYELEDGEDSGSEKSEDVQQVMDGGEDDGEDDNEEDDDSENVIVSKSATDDKVTANEETTNDGGDNNETTVNDEKEEQTLAAE